MSYRITQSRTLRVLLALSFFGVAACDDDTEVPHKSADSGVTDATANTNDANDAQPDSALADSGAHDAADAGDASNSHDAGDAGVTDAALDLDGAVPAQAKAVGKLSLATPSTDWNGAATPATFTDGSVTHLDPSASAATTITLHIGGDRTLSLTLVGAGQQVVGTAFALTPAAAEPKAELVYGEGGTSSWRATAGVVTITRVQGKTIAFAFTDLTLAPYAGAGGNTAKGTAHVTGEGVATLP